jgi:pimeloyl-ACP methyl ester carboxylesterase
MSIVTLESEIIHYEVLGRGRPCFFLHGWVGSWRYWVPTMQAVSIQYRAYALDFWGFGDSAKRPEKYSIDAQVSLLDDFMQHLGISKIALVGHGLGAVVGLSFALHYPQYVDRLLLNSLPLGFYNINPRLRSTTIEELVDWLLGKVPSADAARVEAPKVDSLAIAASLDSLQKVNTLEIVAQIKTPCLLVYGQNDQVVQQPSVEIMDEMPEQLHTILFDQSGHFPMLEEPNKYNRLLYDFLTLASGESPRQLQLKEEWKRRIR